MPDASSIAATPPANGKRLGFLWFGLLLALFLIPGLLGRDPWKADEGYSVGLVLHILETGDAVTPMLAGEPFMEKPPAMYVTAAILAKIFSPILPLHEGMRMANVFFNLITLLAVGLASREIYGLKRTEPLTPALSPKGGEGEEGKPLTPALSPKGAREGKVWLAPVLLMGCIGPIHNFHLMITDVALLTGFALGHWGMILSLRRPWLGGGIAGTGIGLAFMAKGLIGPGFMGVPIVLLPILFRTWRNQNYIKTLISMGIFLLPWLVIWPGLLYLRSPELFHVWFWDNNIGRFIGTSGVGSKNEPLFYFKALPWFAWPVLPLAVLAWWQKRRTLRSNAGLLYCLLSFGVMLTVLSISSDGRQLYAQPMLIPLAIAGALAVASLDGRPALYAQRGIAVFFGVVFAGVWVGACAQWTRHPAWLWAKMHTQSPDYVPHIEPVICLLGLCFMGAFIWRLARSNRLSGTDAVINWTVGVAGTYFLIMTLFLNLFNTRNTYRFVGAAVKAALGEQPAAVASLGLGESQRAMLYYYAGLKTRRVEVHPEALDECPYMLIQGNYKNGGNMEPPSRGRWEMISESRQGGRESFRLYKRLSGNSLSPTEKQ